jgi:Kdo2-lipid IVA lauroyltransferase/acyltransferase
LKQSPVDPQKTKFQPPLVGPFGLFSRLEAFGFWLFMRMIQALPLETAANFSARVWQAIAPHLYRHKRALKHLQMAFPEKTPRECENIAYDMWGHLGATFAESFHLPQLAREPERYDIVASPEAEIIMREHRGLVMVSLHMGNWEINALAAMKMGLQLAGAYQKIKNPLIDSMVREMRIPYYPLGLFSKGHEAAKALLKVVRQGQAVALMADLREGRGLDVPFFGMPAPSNPFPALLARGLKVPMVAACTIRTGPARYRIEVEVIHIPNSEDREQDIHVATANIQACFEKMVRSHPEQWMWGHRRWG